MKTIEVIWRAIKRKQFRGKDALAKAKQFTLDIKPEADGEVQVFEVSDDNTTAWFDTENGTFERFEMDG